jgi:hypothetical protein
MNGLFYTNELVLSCRKPEFDDVCIDFALLPTTGAWINRTRTARDELLSGFLGYKEGIDSISVQILM